MAKAIKPDVESFARIRVIGVGGSGGNAVNHMVQSHVEGVDFIAVNTDAQDLHKSKARKKTISLAMLRAHGVVDKRGKIIPREPVLSKKALAYAAKIVKSRRLSIKFLKKSGIIERPGKLARPYR